MKLSFLNHSGFLLDDGHRAYVFDYFKDPAGLVKKAQAEGRELWFFATHLHGDHYSPRILDFNTPTTKYIVHEDVPKQGLPTDRTTFMAVGDETTIDGVKITMYGSTDEGGSFLLTFPNITVFHAGDLNWWHWLGDTDENNRFAREYARKEFNRVQGMKADVVMFPVDARLEAAREWGPIEFLHHVEQPKLFVPMHANGPIWEPSIYFKALYEDLPLWIPQHDGDTTDLKPYETAQQG